MYRCGKCRSENLSARYTLKTPTDGTGDSLLDISDFSPSDLCLDEGYPMICEECDAEGLPWEWWVPEDGIERDENEAGLARTEPRKRTLFPSHVMLDVNLGHISLEDYKLMGQRAAIGDSETDILPVLRFSFGYIVQLLEGWNEPESEEVVLARACGFSEAFVGVALACAATGASYIRFDRDGTVNPDFPVFNW